MMNRGSAPSLVRDCNPVMVWRHSHILTNHFIQSFVQSFAPLCYINSKPEHMPIAQMGTAWLPPTVKSVVEEEDAPTSPPELLIDAVRSTISTEKHRNTAKLAAEALELHQDRKERQAEQRRLRFAKDPPERLPAPSTPWGQGGEQLREETDYVGCQRRLDERVSPTVSPQSRRDRDRAARRARVKLQLGDPDLAALGARHAAATAAIDEPNEAAANKNTNPNPEQNPNPGQT